MHLHTALVVDSDWWMTAARCSSDLRELAAPQRRYTSRRSSLEPESLTSFSCLAAKRKASGRSRPSTTTLRGAEMAYGVSSSSPKNRRNSNLATHTAAARARETPSPVHGGERHDAQAVAAWRVESHVASIHGTRPHTSGPTNHSAQVTHWHKETRVLGEPHTHAHTHTHTHTHTPTRRFHTTVLEHQVLGLVALVRPVQADVLLGGCRCRASQLDCHATCRRCSRR